MTSALPSTSPTRLPRIAFVVLAHGAVDHLVELVRVLVADGDTAVIHYDRNSGESEFGRLRALLENLPSVHFAERVACGWGEFSLVQGTLNALRTLEHAAEPFDYAYLVSGADLPIRPIADLKRFLRQTPEKEYIQSNPIDEGQWVVGGLQEERFVYRFPFNERTQRARFYGYLKLQQLLRMKRKPPQGLRLCIGSQWWCLTKSTVTAILRLLETRTDITPYFRGTWIPDEGFFQTLVRNVAQEDRITGVTLTLFEFSDYGNPVVFYDEHEPYLDRKPFFFARKFGMSARRSRQRLLARAVQDDNAGGTDVDPLQDPLSYRAFVEPNRVRSGARRHPGAMEDEWYGELRWNRTPIHVIISDFDLVDGLEKRLAESMPEVTWHGRLFDPKAIHFCGGADIFAGYHANRLKVRERNPIGFLTNVAASTPAGIGFILCRHDSALVREVILNLDGTKALFWAKAGATHLSRPDALDIASLAHVIERRFGSFDIFTGELARVANISADMDRQTRPAADYLMFGRSHSPLRDSLWQMGEGSDAQLTLPGKATPDPLKTMRAALLAHIQAVTMDPATAARRQALATFLGAELPSLPHGAAARRARK